jgi:LCP family protein required for cell wall assembly
MIIRCGLNIYNVKEGIFMEDKKTRSAKHKPNKKKRKKTIIIYSIIFVLLAVIAGFAGSFYYELGKINNTEIPKTNEGLGINTKVQEDIEKVDPNNEIINFALFGLDRRDKNEPSRSDAIMIATLDKKHKKIKISSIMRDLYVEVPGHGKTKLNEAYAYGGPLLAIKTLNQNLNLNIRDFVSIDFYNMEELIDSLGGVPIDIKKEEINAVNGMMTELAQLGGYAPPFIKKAGLQTLNGKQALAYTRTRFIGNGDYERTERQRTVLTALFNKVVQSGPAKISALLPFINTSIDKGEIISLGTTVLTSGIRDLEQSRFPIDGFAKDSYINGISYVTTDLKATSNHIYEYLYNDIKPEAK